MDASPDINAIAMLESLTVVDVEHRLRELDGEMRALRTILRALRARERSREVGGNAEGTDGR